jgi:hypothetical protein
MYSLMSMVSDCGETSSCRGFPILSLCFASCIFYGALGFLKCYFTVKNISKRKSEENAIDFYTSVGPP